VPPEAPPEGAFKSSYTRNWEVDRVTEKTAMPAGRVARVSVGALVDGTYQTVDGSPKFVSRDKVELTRLQDLIKGAVGFDAARGDVVQIECAQFARTEEVVGVTPPLTIPTSFSFKGRPWWNYAAAGGAVAVLAAGMLLMRRKKAKKVEAEKLLEEQKVAEEAEAEKEQMLLDATRGPLELPPQKPKTNPEEDRVAALEMAVRDPATAAIILREWLNSTSESQSARF
jgi:flagellar M-ring protein FliF